MEFSIKLYKNKILNQLSQVIISKKNIAFLSRKIDLVLANSADPVEMLHYMASHLGLHYLPQSLGVYGSQRVKDQS